MTDQTGGISCFAAEGGMTGLVCQKCGYRQQWRQYHQIEPSAHPEWREELLEGTFFQWDCPECGNYAELSYPCRYLDERAGLSIVMRPGLQTGTGDDVLNAMNQRLEGLAMPGFLHRAVGTFFSMRELVRIRDAGLDDRVVNLLKPLIIGQLQSMGKEIWNGFFIGVEQGRSDGEPLGDVLYLAGGGDTEAAYREDIYWFDIHQTNNEVLRQGINHTGYLICEEMLQKSGVGEDDGLYHLYDLSWAIDFHNQQRGR